GSARWPRPHRVSRLGPSGGSQHAKPLADHGSRLVERAAELRGDPAEIASVRSLPPRQGAISLTLLRGESRIDRLKPDVPHVKQFDDRYRSTIGAHDDADVPCFWQCQPFRSEFERQAGGRSLPADSDELSELIGQGWRVAEGERVRPGLVMGMLDWQRAE